MDAEQSKTHAEDNSVWTAPNRIGGWLILPGIGLAFGCVIGVVNLAHSLSLMTDVLAAGYSGMFFRAVVVDVLLLAFTIFATVRFLGRKRNAPRVVIALFATGVIVDSLLLLAAQLEGQSLDLDVGTAFARGALIACVWIVYFSVSKRVKATFVN